jgi:hypothetical protein
MARAFDEITPSAERDAAGIDGLPALPAPPD